MCIDVWPHILLYGISAFFLVFWFGRFCFATKIEIERDQ